MLYTSLYMQYQPSEKNLLNQHIQYESFQNSDHIYQLVFERLLR